MRSWTRAGQLEMVEELFRLCDQSAHLATRERACGVQPCPATDVQPLVERSRPVLKEWHAALLGGERLGRLDLVTLHRTVAGAVSRAEQALSARGS